MPGFPGPAQSTLKNAGPGQQGQAIAQQLGNTAPGYVPVASTLGDLFNSSTGTSIKYIIYWGIAALALYALAGPYPDLATGFTVLLIVGVVLTHYRDYVKLFSPPSK